MLKDFYYYVGYSYEDQFGKEDRYALLKNEYPMDWFYGQLAKGGANVVINCIEEISILEYTNLKTLKKEIK